MTKDRTTFISTTMLIAFCCLLFGASFLHAGNWPQWRGPFFNGSSDETGLPAVWDETKNVSWTVKLPGESGATPVVWGDRIFVSSVDKSREEIIALCFRVSDGKRLWRKVVGKDRPMPRNNMASCSPVTDGKTVYFSYGTGDIVAFDMYGKKIWAKNICTDSEIFSIQFGYSSSPLLYKGKLYIIVLQNSNPRRYFHLKITTKKPLDSYLLALDPKTGKELWKVKRPSDGIDESKEAYSSPIPYKWKGREEILIFGGDCLTGHDPATGRELWRWGGYNTRKNPHWRTVPSPLTFDGLIYVSAPKHGPLFAIKAGANGTVGKDFIAWTNEKDAMDASMPLIYKNRLYFLQDDRKVILCVEPKTGRVIWRERLPARTVFRAGITGADGKLYCMDESGLVFVLKAGDEFKLLLKIKMGRHESRSQIVAAAGRLFIRTPEKLYCLKKKQ